MTQGANESLPGRAGPGDTPLGRTLTIARRLLVVAAYAVWIGGLAFYGSVVIPIGTEVVGGHAVQGFVTQRVTRVVNVISVPALAVLLWNFVAEWRAAGRRPRAAVAITWGVMLAAQVVLFPLHPVLGGMVDPQARSVLDPPRFGPLHETYIKVTAVQHLAGLVHLWFVLLVWSIPAAAVTECCAALTITRDEPAGAETANGR